MQARGPQCPANPSLGCPPSRIRREERPALPAQVEGEARPSRPSGRAGAAARPAPPLQGAEGRAQGGRVLTQPARTGAQADRCTAALPGLAAPGLPLPTLGCQDAGGRERGGRAAGTDRRTARVNGALHCHAPSTAPAHGKGVWNTCASREEAPLPPAPGLLSGFANGVSGDSKNSKFAISLMVASIKQLLGT